MISIIGAGPVGCHLASLLAKKEDVQIFEEHSQIGLPVQCTGLVTPALNELVKIRKSFIVNKIGKFKIFSPSNKAVEFRLRNKNILINRMLFDRYMAEKAREKGIKFFLNHKFIDFKDKKMVFKVGNKIKKIKTDILVGADGPLSQVAKSTGLFRNRRFMIGVQARVSMNLDPEVIESYIIKKGFGWLVPESDKIARLGVAVYDNPNFHFKDLLKKRAKKCKIREYQSGLIPIYNPDVKIQKDNVFLAGDAATTIKASTGGGIIHGLMSAEELNKAIIHDEDYQYLFNKRAGKDLKLHLLMRKKIDRFSEKDYDKLIGLFGRDGLREIIEGFDRDFPSKFMFKLLLKEPRLIKFGFI